MDDYSKNYDVLHKKQYQTVPSLEIRCGRMIGSAFIYLFLAWFFSQFMTSGAGEGRSVLAIFQVRKVLKLLGIAKSSEDEMMGSSQTGEATATPEDLEALGDN